MKILAGKKNKTVLISGICLMMMASALSAHDRHATHIGSNWGHDHSHAHSHRYSYDRLRYVVIRDESAVKTTDYDTATDDLPTKAPVMEHDDRGHEVIIEDRE